MARVTNIYEGTLKDIDTFSKPATEHIMKTYIRINHTHTIG